MICGIVCNQGTAATVTAPYWRIYVTANNGDANYTSLNEWQWHEAYGGADLTDLGTPAFNQSSAFMGVSLQTAAYLTDNDPHTDPNNAWVTNTGLAAPSWASIGLKNSGNVLTAYSIREVVMFPQTGLVARAPKDFLIQSSPDAVTWTTVVSFSGITSWTSGVSKTFTVQ